MLRFPPPEKLISSSSFHRLDMTLADAEALNPNEPLFMRHSPGEMDGVFKSVCWQHVSLHQLVVYEHLLYPAGHD